MNKNKVISITLLGIILCSCNEKDVLPELKVNVQIESLTRAEKEEFQPGDAIGLFIQDKNEDNYNQCDCSFNNKVVYADSQWILNSPIIAGNEEGCVYAYYPYKEGILSIDKVPLESASQTDYLYATPVNVNMEKSNITLRMQHAMSLVRFIIKKEGYDGKGVVSRVALQNIHTSGMMDSRTGYITVSNIGNEAYTGEYQLTEEVPLVLSVISLPLSVTSTTAYITIDGEKYRYDLSPSNWTAGKITSYTLQIDTVTNTLFAVENTTIESWTSGENYTGNLTNEGFQVDHEA